MAETPAAEPLRIRLRDGRTLSASVTGDPSATPVLFFHGTPGSRLGPPPQRFLIRPDVRLISFDRAGYGGSTRCSGERVVSDIVEDVEDLLAAVGVDHFAALGISGGGPFALACAARLPARVRALALLAAPAPSGDGFDRRAGMNAKEIEEQDLARGGDPDLLWAFLEREAAAMLAKADSPPPIAAAFALALAPGVGGWFDDDRMFVRFEHGWGFSLNDVVAPTRIFHGDADDCVPPQHAERLCALLPDASLTWLPGVHHFAMAPHAPAALDFLCERFQAAR